MRTLEESQRRLKELAGSDLDAVLTSDGHSYLLQEAQEKLRQSLSAQRSFAEMHLSVLNALPAHIALIDHTGKIISVNDGWRAYAEQGGLGDESGGVGQNYLEICERSEGDGSEETRRIGAGIRAVLTGVARKFETEYPCDQQWFRLMVAPLLKRAPTGATVMHIDITERKKILEAVRRSEEQFRSMFDAAATGIAISTPDGFFLQVNEAYSHMLGYTQEELIGRNCATLTHADDLAHNLKLRDELLAGQRDGFVMEKRYLKKNGDIIWTRHSVSATHGDQGEIATLIVVAENITGAKESAEQLLSKTALLEAQINSTLDGVLVVDCEGKAILRNQGLIDLWNLPWAASDDRDGQARFERVLSRVKNPKDMAEKTAFLYANPDEVSRDEIELLDGRYLDRFSGPVRGSDGKYYGRLWSFRDITARKLADLRASEQAELIKMASSVGKLGAWAVDVAGGKVLWSDEVRRIHEVDDDFMPDLETALDFFTPESQVILKEAIAGEQPYDLEVSLVTAKGNKLWVRITSAIEKKDGVPHRLYGVVQDVTEKRKSEARMRRLVDSNVQGVFFWNTRGKILGGNDAFLGIVGYSRADLDAGIMDWKAMTPPEYNALTAKAMDELAATGVCKSYEQEFIRKDGSRVPVVIGAATFEDNAHEGVCFVLDVGERKKLEQQFFRAQRMESIGTLAGGVAHDLNNILAPIIMSIELLKMSSNNPQTDKTLATIESCAKRGAEVVRQVLSFARGVEGQRIEIKIINVFNDLRSIIKDTFPRNIKLHFAYPGDSWTILGDPTQVHQILLNLCVNARDAMPDGGRLSVVAENCVLDDQYAAMDAQAKPGHYVRISVTDSGTGIPQTIIDRIFEPFFTTKQSNVGTGLGLSTVMAIVKSHEGTINVYSEQGKGTTFKVYLPVAEPSIATNRELHAQHSLRRGNGETILVVDDEVSILTITRQTLEAFGYRVLTAEDGAEALAIYTEHKSEIAAVVTDMMMPVMDGPSLIRVLTRLNPAIKIALASGLTTNGSGSRSPGYGVNHFLTKPYTAELLLRTLGTLLDEA